MFAFEWVVREHARRTNRAAQFSAAVMSILLWSFGSCAASASTYYGYSKLSISGSPSSSVVAGQSYAFAPTVSGGWGGTLKFSIANKPAWASFNTSNGKLSGTPSTASEGTFSGIVISVSNRRASASLAAFSIQVKAPATAAKPTISGTPSASATVGSSYVFQPKASDSDGDALSFSISNKPSWATFSIATGELSGTPTTAAVGTYVNIVISVSDGTQSASLPGFAITVAQPQTASTGTASLVWTEPTTNTDGTPITNLAGYTITYGTSASALNQSVDITTPSTTAYTLQNLNAGTWYFAIAAYTSGGSQSALSNVVSKTIP